MPSVFLGDTTNVPSTAFDTSIVVIHALCKSGIFPITLSTTCQIRGLYISSCRALSSTFTPGRAISAGFLKFITAVVVPSTPSLAVSMAVFALSPARVVPASSLNLPNTNHLIVCLASFSSIFLDTVM